jgi:putative hemolysin
MAGRSDEREGAAPRRLDCRARGEKRGFVARRRGDGVGIEEHPLGDGEETLDVRRVVTALDLGARRGRCVAPAGERSEQDL